MTIAEVGFTFADSEVIQELLQKVSQ